MPGRSRSDDRKAIEAFARIHRGVAGDDPQVAARRRVVPPVEAEQTYAGPTNGSGPIHGGYQPLPALPNLERPKMGKRVLAGVVAAVVVVLVAFGIAGATGGTHHQKGRTAGGTAAAAGTHGSAAGSRHASARHRAKKDASTTTVRSNKTTVTTAAGTGPLAPTSTSAGGATYTVGSAGSPLTVVISGTSGSCWAEASPAVGGTVKWTGTIDPGQQQTLPSSPGWWIRLGAPEHVSITADGRTLKLPTGGQPLDVSINLD